MHTCRQFWNNKIQLLLCIILIYDWILLIDIYEFIFLRSLLELDFSLLFGVIFSIIKKIWFRKLFVWEFEEFSWFQAIFFLFLIIAVLTSNHMLIYLLTNWLTASFNNYYLLLRKEIKIRILKALPFKNCKDCQTQTTLLIFV